MQKSIFQFVVLTTILSSMLLFLSSCGSESASDSSSSDTRDQTETDKKEITVPVFNADSAYRFVEHQVNFGPRVPNTQEHDLCRQWLVSQMDRWADQVIEQQFTATTYKGEKLKSTNIIGIFNPKASKRILLAAHWDTRSTADYDPDPERRSEPILGADDGASGVGVLLEIARNLAEFPLEIGIDIIFFDAEDQGADGGGNADSWCLGAQHWSRNPHVKGYKAEFGILLDMVGASGARFTMEGTSMTYAPDIMNRVWRLAQGMGYGGYFVSERTGPITDDHLFVNMITGIPMINIINRPVQTSTGFGAYWHTHSDNMDVIHPSTLKATGQVVLAVVYQTAKGTFL